MCVVLGLAACGGSSGSGNPDAPMADGPEGIDAAPDAPPDGPPAPATITLTGTATARAINGAQPVAGATIGAYQSVNETTPVATATSAADGTFTLTITTGGSALDGYLKATKTGYADSYLYSPAPIATDMANLPINMLTTGNYGTLYALTQTQQGANKGTIAVIVQDSALAPIAGATVAGTPAATYKYDGANGLPSNSATVTAADGVGYYLNAPLGAISVTAAKTGATFTAHTVKVFADSLTTTVIVKQ